MNLSALLDDSRSVSGNQCAVKSVHERFLEQPGARYHVNNDGTFVKREENCRVHCQWPIEKRHDGELREVGNDKHGANHRGCERAIRNNSVEQWLP